MRSTVVLLLAALFLAALPAAAQAPALGPGPFTNIRVTRKGLLFTVAKGAADATLFAGNVEVAAADGAAFVPFDGKAVVKRGGSQLLQRGTVAGRTIDEFFPAGEQRRLRVRAGGATTEVDVVRAGDGFLVAYTQRAPAAPIALTESVTRDGVDVAGDVDLRLALAPSGPPAYDVAVAVRAPELPEGVDDLSTRVVARSVATGTTYFDRGGYAGDGRTRFVHLALPEGAYTLTVLQTATLGNPLVATTSLRADYAVPATVEVSRQTRAFEVELPPISLPALVPATVVLSGFEPFEPSFSNRLAVTVSVASETASFLTTRDVGSVEPVAVEIALPEGEHAVSVTVRGGAEGPNASTHRASFTFPARRLEAETRLELPPLVRVTGAVLDPHGSLADAAEGPPEDPPFHAVGITNGAFGGTGELTGFARSYRFVVARGTTGRLNASFEVGLGGGDRGLLLLQQVGPQLELGEDREVDVEVPALPPVATLAGRVVDANGQGVPYALVAAESGDVEGLEGEQFFSFAIAGRDGSYRLRVLHGRAYSVSAFTIRF
jgi:hypothetical protein